jgi:hypothetical protein
MGAAHIVQHHCNSAASRSAILFRAQPVQFDIQPFAIVHPSVSFFRSKDTKTFAGVVIFQ